MAYSHKFKREIDFKNMTVEDAYALGWEAGYEGMDDLPPEQMDSQFINDWYRGHSAGDEHFDMKHG